MINESRERTNQWADFLKSRCRKQLLEIGREWPHLRSIYIDYGEVIRFARIIPGTTDGEAIGGELADEILDNPGKVIEDIQDAITNNNLIKKMDGKEIKKDAINIRFRGIGRKVLLRDLRADDVGKCIGVDGIVTRATEVRPRLIEAVFKCPAGHFTKKAQGPGKMAEPDGCGTDGCTFKKLDLIPKRSTFSNQQKLRIQENADGLHPGQQPQTMDVVILDDACDQLYPGDRATLNCIVRSAQRIVKGEKSTVFDLYLDLSSVEAEERDFEEVTISEEAEAKIKEIAKSGNALDMISASIAPSIYGYTEIKKGAALQMFGGVTAENADGSINRGDIHILLLGDPGSAKSKLIKYVSRQSPRGVFVSSVTSSGVGLTGMASRDEDGRWTIEAGALPLADGGIAAIDEIDKADPETLDSLLNIMEDGEVRITKAGQNRLLKARDSLICAGNPKDERFDTFGDTGIADQITLPAAFLSRFDLIFIMVDRPEAALDEARSRHVIKTRYIGECRTAGKLDRVTEAERKEVEPQIPAELLKQYIAYARRNVIPIMNPQVREYLTKHYVEIRGATNNPDSPSPATMRQQEALVRLAEAVAKIRLSPEVALKDAEAAIGIFDSCIRAIATDPHTKQVDWGRVPGQGVANSKKKLIERIRETIKNEMSGGPGGVSIDLVYAKLEPQGFTNKNEIKGVIDEMAKNGDLSQPRLSIEAYRVT
jgi:replicative DNA helicase Mcm